MLSSRLQTIFDFVPENKIVADIGTDHGYLAIELINKKKSKHVYAVDNKEGPLKSASLNLKRYCKYPEKISLQLSNGLEALPESVEVIVLAGMGIANIIDILEYRIDFIKDKLIIIESKKNLYKFRIWSKNKGFMILEEALTFENHFYTTLVIKRTEKVLNYDLNELWLGPCLLKKSEPIFFNYLESEYRRLSNLEKLGDNTDYYEVIKETLSKKSLKNQF